MDLERDMKSLAVPPSEDVTYKLLKRLYEAKTEIEENLVANGINEEHGSLFITLYSLLQIISPILFKREFILIQRTVYNAEGNSYELVTEIVSLISEENQILSKFFRSVAPETVVSQEVFKDQTPMVASSFTTIKRKDEIFKVLGIFINKDRDGVVSNNKTPRTAKKEQNKPWEIKPTDLSNL